MKPLNISKIAEISPISATTRSRFAPRSNSRRGYRHKQLGVVLFFTLVALLAMSLAAVALIRSVDTSGMITGNLAFKHAATSAADAGVEASMAWLGITTADNSAIDIKVDGTHPLNNTDLVNRPGYHASFNPALNITDPLTWTGTNSVAIAEDIGEHQVRFIIQRLCRGSGLGLEQTDCLVADSPAGGNEEAVYHADRSCGDKPCPPQGKPAQTRITVRAVGRSQAVSFVQGFVF